MNYSTVIFDLDGTILNTVADLNGSLNYVLEKYGLPLRTVTETARFLGNGIRRLIELGAGNGVPAETLDAMFADFKVHYGAHCLDRTRPYEGIPELVAALRASGRKTAVVSNKADFAVQTLHETFFRGLIARSIGERPGCRRKPEADMVELALSMLGADKETAVYVGDSDVDAQTAKNAGMACVLVDWGFRDRSVLEPYGFPVVSTADALLAEIIK